MCGGVTADAEANFSNLQRALSALQDRRLASSSQSLRASPFSIESDCPDTRASDHPPSLLMTTPSPPSAADWSADDLLDLMTAENDPDHRCASPGPPSRGVPVRHSVGPTEPLAQPPDAPLTCAEGHECSPFTALMGSRCQFDGFRMCSPGKIHRVAHGGASCASLIGFWRVNTSGS